MNEIVRGLWIGDWTDTVNEESLERYGFSRVLCVVPHQHAPPEMRKEYRKLKVMHWHYEDQKETEIEPPLEFIDEGLREGFVLVHCGAGIDRSPTVVMLYLVRHLGFSKEASIDLIKGKRPVAKPHPEEVEKWLRG